VEKVERQNKKIKLKKRRIMTGNKGRRTRRRKQWKQRKKQEGED
jgi:hypothetical protein